MRAAVVVFPGSNCDRDMAVGFKNAGFDVEMVWHKDSTLPEGIDIVGVPGGFSYGDYLRCGAIAAQSPICGDLVNHANRGGYVLGVCNGFQVLTETGLLPGVLMRNKALKYLCKTVGLSVANAETAFTAGFSEGQEIQIPIAHHDGNYFADAETLERIEGEGQVAFRYTNNPNGSQRDIAGLVSANGRVLGMMPHPERAAEDAHGNSDGAGMFASLAQALERAPA